MFKSPGEVRSKTLSTDEVYGFIKNGNVNGLTVHKADDTWRENESETYDRFVSFDVSNFDGKNMYYRGEHYYKNPPTYKVLTNNCDNMTIDIFSYGKIELTDTIKPDSNYYKQTQIDNTFYWDIREK